MNKIGFIGCGVMGQYMVGNLIKKGYSVNVFNRTYQKAKKLEELGAIAFDNIKDCIKDVDIIITIVGYPKDVQEVYNDIFKYGKKNTIAIDMTTSSPSLAKELFIKGQQYAISILDAPVSGGDTGAKNGTLSIMVGGNKNVFEQCNNIFMAMGTNINYIGESGSGQHCKLANQIAIAATIAGVNEAIKYTQQNNLDPTIVLNAISKGAAASWQMSNNGTKMINHDDSAGFYIKHFIKDMKLAQAEAHKINLELSVLNIVEAMYEKLSDQNMDDLGTQAIYKIYE